MPAESFVYDPLQRELGPVSDHRVQSSDPRGQPCCAMEQRGYGTARCRERVRLFGTRCADPVLPGELLEPESQSDVAWRELRQCEQPHGWRQYLYTFVRFHFDLGRFARGDASGCDLL